MLLNASFHQSRSPTRRGVGWSFPFRSRLLASVVSLLPSSWGLSSPILLLISLIEHPLIEHPLIFSASATSMSDPLSIAGSVLGLLTLGLQVSKQLHDYYTKYKSRDDDLQHLLQKIDRLSTCL